MRPIYITTANLPAVGTTYTQAVPMDIYIAPGQVSVIGVATAGTSASLSLQVTNDDIFATDYNPLTGNWLTLPATTFSNSGALTPSNPVEATLTAVPRAIRVGFAGCVGNPTVGLQIVQSGIGGT